jgi:isoleucyl-tRNA synthetase
VLTHGFTLDGKGRKMSKSLGNVIAPQEIIKKFGAEIIRLWVAAEDYREDVRISDEILNRLVEAYRRLRNTARFLISNLYDFDPDKDSLLLQDLDELDRWILHRTQTVLSRCREAYERYEFHVVYHTLNNFCSVDLSAQYLDIVKDRLYCEGAKSRKRRAAQTAVYRILDVLVHLMAPILSFTAEEIWQYISDSNKRPSSVFLSRIPQVDGAFADQKLAEKWDRVFAERGEVLKALEQARAAGLIGHSLDARVTLRSQNGNQDSPLRGMVDAGEKKLEDILIVSQVELSNESTPTTDEQVSSYRADLLDALIVVAKADGNKCERCWKYDVDIGKDADHPTVCPRCAGVLSAGASA